MNSKAPIAEKWKWAPVIAFACVALTFSLYYGIPTFAQDPNPPSESQAAPAQNDDSAEAASTEEVKPSEDLPNSSCMDCHNPDILKLSKEELADQVVVDENAPPARPKPKFIMGDLNLSIDAEKFAAGVHADTTCVTCHTGIAEIPHKQRLGAVNCKECHDESVENIKQSAHGDIAAAKGLGCIGCHDVHYGKGKEFYGNEFKRKACVDCHKAYALDPAKGHKNLYAADIHLRNLDCMLCHAGKEPGVHFIATVKQHSANCEACHARKTILSEEKPEYKGFWSYISLTRFINGEVLKKFGYVIGANRIPALDTIIILAFIAPFALPILHGGMRILTRRKGPIDLPEEKILLHPLIERIWHWVQALCIVMLIITGVILHWPEWFPGWFHWAVNTHNWFGWLTVVFFGVWLIYNLVTGRIRHYIPRKGEIPGGMIKQAKFYGYGIFKHEPHPYAPSETNKFNPLQKIAYLQFQAILLPILLLSGLLYMYPESFQGVVNVLGGMSVVAIIHFILGGLFAAFLVAHIYLATTGETIGENFKAIITGYGLKSDHDDHGHA